VTGSSYSAQTILAFLRPDVNRRARRERMAVLADNIFYYYTPIVSDLLFRTDF
jgi:hypothetical protein